MYVCIYVKKNSQGDFRLMSFTAGRCSTPLIPNDQLRRNGVRSSDLIVCSPVPSEVRKPIATNPDRRSESAGVGPKGLYEPNRTDRSVLL